MTPQPPSDHPGLDALADLAEDLLPPEQAEQLHRHLASCPSCADDYAALCGLPELLAAAPAPPMPEDVADRLNAALAAESAARRETRPAVPTAVPTAAPSGGPSGGPQTAGRPAGTAPAATGPGRPPRRRRRTTAILLVTAAVAAALTLGGVLLNLPGSQQGASTASAAKDVAARPSLADGAAASTTAPRTPHTQPTEGAAAGTTDFRAEQLPEQIRRLLPARPTEQIGPADSQPLGGPAAAPCVLAAAGHTGEQPVATGAGSYQGRPVLALVYRLPGQADRLDVYLATPDCPGSAILLHSTVPAP
ncbi:zf-HC2 domain-containing protein [Kitasatospora sp. NPDC049285]|uniref:zf-HC2 domain-containing protein n=1 Tax=Kitasatospora sp. NPDC049285 TaxID=3157096 RepID=UPI00342D3F02